MIYMQTREAKCNVLAPLAYNAMAMLHKYSPPGSYCRGLSAAGIAGVAIAGALLVAIAVGIYLCIRYKNRRNRVRQGGVVIRQPPPPPQRGPPQPKPMRTYIKFQFPSPRPKHMHLCSSTTAPAKSFKI